jgi:UvrD-like helicase C-terminal domain
VDTQDEGLALEDHELHVRLDEDEEVSCGLDELTHAYAVSIHHAQGSEYPCVVVPVTTSAWLMLQRNLLYTAVTRAKRLVVLVGSRRALAKAVRTRARSAATPPSPNGSSRTGEDRCGSQPALGGPAATGCGRARGADPRSGGADRTVRVPPRRRTGLAILESLRRGSVTWSACTAWSDSLSL